MKRYIKILLIFFFNSLALIASSANFSSVADGGWTSNSTWGGSSNPGNSTADNVTINSNDSVYTTNNIAIKNGGYLTIKSGSVLVVNDMEFANGSHISIESGGKLIVNGNFINKNNSNDVVINGTINVSGSFENGTGGVVTGIGAISVSGSFSGSGTTFGIPNSTVTSNSTVTGSNLPIELLFIDYSISINSVEIIWATSSEINNDYFTIEKSTDGILFEAIGIVEGAGNSNSQINYSFSDENPSNGISFYRLKQTDYDGKFEYVGTLVCNTNSKGEFSLKALSSGSLNTELLIEGYSGSYLIEVYSIAGQRMYSLSSYCESESNIFVIPSEFFPNGTYIVKFATEDGQIISTKFIR